MLSTILATALLALGANAASHSIDVGENGIKFDPETTTAAIGDTLEFHFYSGTGGHSVVEGSFASPCQPATNGFFSGYIPGSKEGEMTFVVNVTSTDPIWFYCSLALHCGSGMVGVVNPPADKTIEQYAAAAQGKSASAPAALTGGSLATISETDSDSSTSAPSTTAPSGSAATNSATTTTGSGSATTTGGSTATSGTAAPSKTPSSAGRAELSVMLGLTVVLGGLVALMA